MHEMRRAIFYHKGHYCQGAVTAILRDADT